MTWFCLKHNWTPRILCDYPVILRHLRNKFELQVKIVKTKVKHLGHPRAYGGSSSKFSRFPLFGQCHPWRWSSTANKRPLSRCVSPRWPARSSNFLSTVTSCVNLHDGKSWKHMKVIESSSCGFWGRAWQITVQSSNVKKGLTCKTSVKNLIVACTKRAAPISPKGTSNCQWTNRGAGSWYTIYHHLPVVKGVNKPLY